MKKILLIGGLAVSTLTMAQSNDFNKLSIDFGFGMSKTFEPVRPKFETSFNFPYFDLGVRYMINNKLGFKFAVDYSRITNRKDVLSYREFSTNLIGEHFYTVVHWGNLLHSHDWDKMKKFTVIGWGGPGFSQMIGNGNFDNMLNFKGGATLMYKVSPQLALTAQGDLSMYAMGDWYVDMIQRRAFANAPATGVDGYTGGLALGVSYYLGAAAEHADWTPSESGNAAALEALKARIDKAEKDMMDDDKDGVPNYLDQEPGTAEDATVDTKGRTVTVEKVVDMDGDGVLDVNDFCPTIPGTASANGCPDKDNDGVYDFIDKCPTLPGVQSTGGCPEVKNEVKTLMSKAMKGVQFVSGKSTILKKSYSILNQVADVMNANPTYYLDINGHTDNVGNADNNMTLSKERAQAVQTYLMSKGVAADRMKAQGFGQTQPKASNKTSRGRAENRRVEFIIHFEK
ncbi:MAG: OmpA family protein [Bacteroidetes bacterium]|nr:MAG: OmpA family protein [Bacteroidota bacterium]